MSRAQNASGMARRKPQAVLPFGRDVFHAASEEKSRFRLDVRRSLERHRGLTLAIVFLGFLATAAYLIRYWPVYSAEALVAIQPAAAAGATQTSVYDAATTEAWIQQQADSMTRSDVLAGALQKLVNFERSGESDQDAARRLGSQVSVARVKSGLEVAIDAHAGSAQMAADIANAVAASYLENTIRQQQVADAARVTALRQEADHVKNELDGDRAELATLNANSVDNSVRQRDGELGAEIDRLERRYNELDEQLQNVLVEDAAPGTAHVEMPAVAPAHPVPDGVGRNALLMLLMFLMVAVLAAIAVNKMDSRLYVASDVEQIVGFPPVAQLPDTDDVSDEVFDKYLLRLAAAVDEGMRQSDRTGCVFTGTASGTGVTTVATQVRALMEGMNRPAVLVDTVGDRPAIWPGGESERKELGEAQPVMLVQRLASESRVKNGTLVMADAAPITVAAETEVLARSTDCVIVVIESGVTTRGQLRSTACVLKRLDVGAVGFVLNRVTLAKADRAFRNSVIGVERHVRMQRRTRTSGPVRTRRVEAEPARVRREPVTSVEEIVERKPEVVSATETRRSTPTGVPIAQGSASKAPATGVGRVDLSPVDMPRAASAEEIAREQGTISRMEAAGAGTQTSESELPWWLADPVLHPQMPTSRPRASGSREARLSDLRNLFRNKGGETASSVAPPAPSNIAPEPVREVETRPAQPRVAEPEIQLGPDYEELAQRVEERTRRATPEVTTAPEYLPPKASEAQQEEDAASRRERRDTWDNLAILPSWRGQYRRKE
jgi:capsular polysaccharide biosynthesis protein